MSSERSRGLSRGSIYRSAILEVLYLVDEVGEEGVINTDKDDKPYDGAFWKSAIKRQIDVLHPDISEEDDGIPRSTVARRINSLKEEGSVEQVDMPENFNRYTNEGYRITEKGKREYREVVGDFYATLAASCFYDFVLERYRGDCESCEEDGENCENTAIDVLTSGQVHPSVNMDKKTMYNIADQAESPKEVKEMAGLILSWAYLTDAVERRNLPNTGKETSEALKQLSIKNPAVAEIALSTYRLPLSDIFDIFEAWDEYPGFQMPADQYMVTKSVLELQREDEGVLYEEIKQWLEEKEIEYDPRNTIRQCKENGFLRVGEDEEGIKRYKVTEKIAEFVR